MYVCSSCHRISTTIGTPADGYLQGHHVGTCTHCLPEVRGGGESARMKLTVVDGAAEPAAGDAIPLASGI